MTVYLDSDLEVLLKLEAMRRKQPMAEVLREALRSYLSSGPRTSPPGAGASGRGRKGAVTLKELQGSIKVGPGDPVEDVRKARQLMGTEDV